MRGKPVRIAVVYEPGKKPRPVWFELNRRQHKVKETTYYWRDKVGDTPLLHFAVTTDDGGGLYELVFNTLDESWTLHSYKSE